MRTSRDGQSALLLFDVVAILKKEKIDHAVIGAIAASVHGVVRASMDADLVLSKGDHDDPIPALLELSDAYNNRVDMLAGIRGLEAAAFSRAIDVR
jgi:hypothetical protein